MSDKSDFMMREMTVGDTATQVTRSRTSAGFGSISCKHAGTQISFSTDSLGGAYEERARRFAEMILEMCDEKCWLPGDKK